MKITSLTNPHIKHVVKLRNRKDRDGYGQTIVEGHREITRALEAGISIMELYFTADGKSETRGIVQKMIKKETTVYETTKEVFSKISYGDHEEGVLAVVEPKSVELNRYQKVNPLFVVIEGVEKPGNLGAILRTCDGAGVDGVIICDTKTDIYNPNVIRASLGTVFTNKVLVASNEDTLEFLRSNKIKVCATRVQAETLYTKENLTGALAIVVGSEQDGLSSFWADNAQLQVKIPMKGKADSLNVSASAAILLYEAVRQRG